MSQTLFPEDEIRRKKSPPAPLAERMRPTCLEEILGQDHLLAPGRFLAEAIRSDQIASLILWGPPGVGKTTLARILAHHTRSHFVSVSAVLSGVKEVKKIIEEAKYQKQALNRGTILFVDEIHRFNKAQQDAFLSHVENGSITLIGATTENPSFEVIAPLLSRCRVLVLNPLTEEHLTAIMRRALREPEKGLGNRNLQVENARLLQIARFANGDARVALNALEAAAGLAERLDPESRVVTAEMVEEALQKRMLLYDQTGEEHFNLISALHKSLRNSDVDASLYWLGRMLEAGEDPLYVARRLVRFASEDVGLAVPAALGLAVAAKDAVHFIGMPEGKLALAQAVVFLAQAPKSNALYRAYQQVEKDVAQSRHEPVPLHLRNAPTRLMKELEYGRGYRYAHDQKDAVTTMECLPENLRGNRYYEPASRGFEKKIRQRLKELERLRQELKEGKE